MDTVPNTSILRCPSCERALINIGSRVERIHPIPRFLNRYYLRIHAIWIVSLPFLMWIQYHHYPYPIRGAGFHFLALLVLPSILIFFTVKAFPLHRITECPYCGFHESQRLGHSVS
jgi:hypothetical protein